MSESKVTEMLIMTDHSQFTPQSAMVPGVGIEGNPHPRRPRSLKRTFITIGALIIVLGVIGWLFANHYSKQSHLAVQERWTEAVGVYEANKNAVAELQRRGQALSSEALDYQVDTTSLEEYETATLGALTESENVVGNPAAQNTQEGVTDLEARNEEVDVKLSDWRSAANGLENQIASAYLPVHPGFEPTSTADFPKAVETGRMQPSDSWKWVQGNGVGSMLPTPLASSCRLAEADGFRGIECESDGHQFSAVTGQMTFEVSSYDLSVSMIEQCETDWKGQVRYDPYGAPEANSKALLVGCEGDNIDNTPGTELGGFRFPGGDSWVLSFKGKTLPTIVVDYFVSENSNNSCIEGIPEGDKCTLGMMSWAIATTDYAKENPSTYTPEPNVQEESDLSSNSAPYSSGGGGSIVARSCGTLVVPEQHCILPAVTVPAGRSLHWREPAVLGGITLTPLFGDGNSVTIAICSTTYEGTYSIVPWSADFAYVGARDGDVICGSADCADPLSVGYGNTGSNYIQPGECAIGAIPFGSPNGKALQGLHYDNGTDPAVSWDLSADEPTCPNTNPCQ
ncbi:hypothetical protein FYJ24_05210 [Actinomycetaceae bacterium WB03_NA08]|uniref:Uncharacterized protein n=1 Tax=Scrofimicrobium canadense TaxID=2652290 RepID=A0A6N7VR06_9ACTO|nr:hypothetical protein [Scrofimicrobium canadense]MSS84174.1 hypothetical protein [Scrofimicrobium canadense]